MIQLDVFDQLVGADEIDMGDADHINLNDIQSVFNSLLQKVGPMCLGACCISSENLPSDAMCITRVEVIGAGGCDDSCSHAMMRSLVV